MSGFGRLRRWDRSRGRRLIHRSRLRLPWNGHRGHVEGRRRRRTGRGSRPLRGKRGCLRRHWLRLHRLGWRRVRHRLGRHGLLRHALLVHRRRLRGSLRRVVGIDRRLRHPLGANIAPDRWVSLRRLRLHHLTRTLPRGFTSEPPAAADAQGAGELEVCYALMAAARRWYANSACRDARVQANLARLALLH